MTWLGWACSDSGWTNYYTKHVHRDWNWWCKMALFDALGFRWDRTDIPDKVPVHSIERACFRFHRMLAEYVWDAGSLEGNPFTFPEMQTLLNGVTVGGHKMSDQEQILNLAESSKRLLAQVKSEQFRLDKATFCGLQGIVAGMRRWNGDISVAKGRRPTTRPMSAWESLAVIRRCLLSQVLPN